MYSVNDKLYYDSYLKDGYDLSKRYFKIRYLVFDPDLSRSDSFAGNWGPLIMFFLLMSIVTSIVFIRKDIISDQAIFAIQRKRPFVSVKNNQIKDYDEHDIQSVSLDESDRALKEQLRHEAATLQMNEISASVYKLNPNAIGIFVLYMFFFFWYFYSLLSSSFGYPAMVSLGAVLLFVPLYIQNTNNPDFKAKIPDEGSLIFTPDGLHVKEEFYSLDHIDAAVIYLEAFQGFKYREGTSLGKASTTSAGDNNKISFRYGQEVIDLAFILARPSDYWALKNLMSGWSGRGVNTLLQKVFEDDFIIQEMVYFRTPYT